MSDKILSVNFRKHRSRLNSLYHGWSETKISVSQYLYQKVKETKIFDGMVFFSKQMLMMDKTLNGAFVKISRDKENLCASVLELEAGELLGQTELSSFEDLGQVEPRKP